MCLLELTTLTTVFGHWSQSHTHSRLASCSLSPDGDPALVEFGVPVLEDLPSSVNAPVTPLAERYKVLVAVVKHILIEVVHGQLFTVLFACPATYHALVPIKEPDTVPVCSGECEWGPVLGHGEFVLIKIEQRGPEPDGLYYGLSVAQAKVLSKALHCSYCRVTDEDTDCSVIKVGHGHGRGVGA